MKKFIYIINIVLIVLIFIMTHMAIFPLIPMKFIDYSRQNTLEIGLLLSMRFSTVIIHYYLGVTSIKLWPQRKLSAFMSINVLVVIGLLTRVLAEYGETRFMMYFTPLNVILHLSFVAMAFYLGQRTYKRNDKEERLWSIVF